MTDWTEGSGWIRIALTGVGNLFMEKGVEEERRLEVDFQTSTW